MKTEGSIEGLVKAAAYSKSNTTMYVIVSEMGHWARPTLHTKMRAINEFYSR